MGHNDVEFILPNKQTKLISEVKDYMLTATNMNETEAYDFAFRVWQTHNWLVKKLTENMYEDTDGEWHYKDW